MGNCAPAINVYAEIPTSMVCVEKNRLQAEWANATNVYAKLVASLTNHMGKLPKDEYDNKRKAVEDARSVSEKLRHTLDLHLLTDRC